jgi:radical SAM superfamily enzyme YgiQ (UPF0313 family)
MTQKTLTIVVPIRTVFVNQGTGEIPYGPAVVNGILKHHGYDAHVWDLNIDLYRAFTEQWSVLTDLFAIRGYVQTKKSDLDIKIIIKWLKKAIESKLDEVDPDIVLLSVFSSHSLDFVIPLATLLRSVSPDTYIVAGGRGLDNVERSSRLSYAEYYSKYLPIDCVYVGDAENDLVTVLKNKQQGLYTASPVNSAELESMPKPSWQGYDFTKYDGYENKQLRFHITGSKGCVRECTFCDVKTSWPNFITRRGKDIASEMMDTYQNYGVTKFEFTDNLVNGSITEFREMNTVIANELPGVFDYKGYAICRTKQSMPAEDFRLAAMAGAKMFKIGIESGSERVRRDMKKKFSNEDIAWFSDACVSNGIKQSWLMFVGYPTETEEDFQASIDLLKTHSNHAKNGHISVFLSLPMMLTSGSNFMQQYALDYGLEHNTNSSWSDFFWTSDKFNDNTFEVRVDRWRRLTQVINDYGYTHSSTRQQEKFKEIDGLIEIYRQRSGDGKKIIPIIDTSFQQI